MAEMVEHLFTKVALQKYSMMLVLEDEPKFLKTSRYEFSSMDFLNNLRPSSALSVMVIYLKGIVMQKRSP